MTTNSKTKLAFRYFFRSGTSVTSSLYRQKSLQSVKLSIQIYNIWSNLVISQLKVTFWYKFNANWPSFLLVACSKFYKCLFWLRMMSLCCLSALIQGKVPRLSMEGSKSVSKRASREKKRAKFQSSQYSVWDGLFLPWLCSRVSRIFKFCWHIF